jgi:glycerol-3-phosphate dehydrogenase (NAD(P)+)
MEANIGVIGAGALGTALAQRLSENSKEVLLFARKQEVCDDINKTSINAQYYPYQKLYDNITATNNLNDFKNCKII